MEWRICHIERCRYRHRHSKTDSGLQNGKKIDPMRYAIDLSCSVEYSVQYIQERVCSVVQETYTFYGFQIQMPGTPDLSRAPCYDILLASQLGFSSSYSCRGKYLCT